jgi:acyl-homoserine lactone acylase PvdQ
MTNGEGSLRTAGHFLAGVPVNFVGHNADIAWGVTTFGMTLSDVYVEELVIEDGEATGCPDRSPSRGGWRSAHC